MMGTRWRRVALGYLGLVSLQIGVWALVAPRSFYDGFPGGGRAWVSVDGPFNEHLVRDVGALNLALVVVLAAAAWTLSRQLIATAAIASLVWGVPHVVYHLVNTDGLDAGDVAASLTGLIVFVALPVALLVSTRMSTTTQPSPSSSPTSSTTPS